MKCKYTMLCVFLCMLCFLCVCMLCGAAFLCFNLNITNMQFVNNSWRKQQKASWTHYLWYGWRGHSNTDSGRSLPKMRWCISVKVQNMGQNYASRVEQRSRNFPPVWRLRKRLGSTTRQVLECLNALLKLNLTFIAKRNSHVIKLNIFC